MLKSSKFHNRSEKAKFLQTICFTIEDVVLDISREKSIRIPLKIDTRKRHAQSLEISAKLEPKSKPESLENSRTSKKRHA